jgi:hypothetical protein
MSSISSAGSFQRRREALRGARSSTYKAATWSCRKEPGHGFAAAGEILIEEDNQWGFATPGSDSVDE